MGIHVHNPFKHTNWVFAPFETKPMTWAERQRARLIKLRNKRILLKKKIWLWIITIFLIMPLITVIGAIPSLFIRNLDSNILTFWGIASGLFGIILHYKTEELLNI